MKEGVKIGILAGCAALTVTGQTGPSPGSTSFTAAGPDAFPSAAVRGLPDEINTADGAAYTNVVVDKVEPDGLTIRYTPPGGGIGIVKIDFDELSTNWQQQYGFDPQKKLDYEKLEVLAAAQWREQLISNYDAAIANRKAREAAAEAEAEAQKTNSAAPVVATDTNQPATNAPESAPPPPTTP